MCLLSKNGQNEGAIDCKNVATRRQCYHMKANKNVAINEMQSYQMKANVTVRASLQEESATM